MSRNVSVSTIEQVKRTMSCFSRYLRRDFLALLVKMVSKSLHIQTQRKDWRTRDGTFEFLARHWDKAYPLFVERTPINWFATRFDSIEKILCNRKFSMYLYYNWDQYKDTLIQYDFIKFLQSNSLLVMQALEKGDISNSLFTNTKYGIEMGNIIKGFFQQPDSKMITRQDETNKQTIPQIQPIAPIQSPQQTSKEQEQTSTNTIEFPADTEQSIIELLPFDEYFLEDQDFTSLPSEYSCFSNDF